MHKKIFLTSAIAMCIACPSFAEDFPTNGLMQENTTYTNAATETNMDGVYEGTVNAEAQYDDILYNIAAGNYLEGGSESTTGTQCPAGSWCPGLTNATYSATDQGINTCSSVGDGSYASSVAGASANTDCYKKCNMANMGTSFANIPHAIAVSGNDFYGEGVDTCIPTGCDNGWHNYINLDTKIGQSVGDNRADINYYGTFNENNFDELGEKGQSFYGINSNNMWAVDYGSNGKLIGQARCSTQSGQGAWDWNSGSAQTPTTYDYLIDETGVDGAIYCYCNITGYKDTNDDVVKGVFSNWVFFNNRGDKEECALYCPSNCAYNMRQNEDSYLAFRYELFNSAVLTSCEANTININWTDVDPQYAGQNNEGTVTYGGDVVTPVKAVTKPGKTFTGWRFVKPSQQ